MNDIAELQSHWTKELQEEVVIHARGWVHSPTDYALYVGGGFVISYKNLDEINDYLARYFMVK